MPDGSAVLSDVDLVRTFSIPGADITNWSP